MIPASPCSSRHTIPCLQAGWILPCSAKPKSDCVVEYSYGWGIQVIEGWNSRDKVDAKLSVPGMQ